MATMLDQSFLEAMRAAFWPVYVVAISSGVLSFALRKRWCLGRTVFALIAGSVAQAYWEGAGVLTWWQHLAIDVPILFLITMPPRHYWQAAMAGLVLAQIVLHCVWGLAPELARAHWFGVTGIGFLKCAVLLLWSGGARVEGVLSWVSRMAHRVVLVPVQGKSAA